VPQETARHSNATDIKFIVKNTAFSCKTAHLELAFHASGVSSKPLGEPLYVSVQVASRDFGVSGLDGLQNGIVYEDVLVLGLDHVVALRSKARHVTVDIDSLVLPDAL
jgi:hypothetical protein